MKHETVKAVDNGIINHHNKGIIVRLSFARGLFSLFCLLLSIVLFSSSASAFTGCTTISSSGTYTLTANITDSGVGKCINITSSDVILDGGGYTIDGIDGVGSIGVNINSGSSLTNITIKNLNIRDWEEGMHIVSLENSTIDSNNISSNQGFGIWTVFSTNLTINNNHIYDHYLDGITILLGNYVNITNSWIFENGKNLSENPSGIFLDDTTNSVIQNNFLNNTKNTDYGGVLSNTWNISKTSGTNIIGGSKLGGNYYATPEGTGFSQTCNDLNRNGFCDTANTLATDNIDYLPLTEVGNIGSCGTFNSLNGNYFLGTEIKDSGMSICFTIESSFAFTLDGQDHTIDGLSTANSKAFSITGSSSNIIKNMKLTDWTQGIYVTGFSSDNSFENINASNNSWDFETTALFSNNKGQNISLNGTIVSFSGREFKLRGASSPASDPSGYNNISRYVNATNTSATSWLYLNVSYDEASLTGPDEQGLSMWRYNSTPAWEQVSGTNGVNTAEDYVYANITSFSIFAPMISETDTYPPQWVEEPGDQTIQVAEAFTYDVNATDGNGIDSYSINDTVNFQIASGTGLLTNKTSLVAGSYGLNISVNDTVGNTLSKVITVTVEDSVGPVVTVVSPTNTTYELNSPITLTVGADETISAYLYSLDGSANKSFTNTATNISPSLGSHNITFWLNDTSGNWGSATEYFTVSDMTGPSITISSPGNTTYEIATNFTITFNTSESIDVFHYQLDGGSNTSFSNGSTEVNTSTLGLGSHNIMVWANDTSGNWGYNTTWFTVVDTGAPVIVFVSPTESNNTVITTNYTVINITANEALDTAILSWNSSNKSMTGSGTNWFVNMTDQSNGEYTYKVWGNDTSGNPAWSETRLVTINYTAPVYRVHNLDTNKNYTTLQAAVDDAATLTGHRISLDAGTLSENIVVSKSLNITGSGIGLTIIKALDANSHAIRLTADYTNVSGLTISGATGVKAGISAESNGNIIYGLNSSQNYDGMIISGDNNTVNDSYTYDNSNSGITINSSSGSLISNNTVMGGSAGIDLSSSNANVVTANNVSASSNGVVLTGSSSNNLTDNLLMNNVDKGILLISSSASNTIYNNTVTDNGNGIAISFSSNNNNITRNVFASNTALGVDLQAHNNLFTSNNASYNSRGYSLSQATNNTFTNNIASNNTAWDFYMASSSTNNTVTNITVNPSISFTGENIALKSAVAPAEDPTGYRNISKYLNITNTTNTHSWIYLNMSYEESDVTGLDESTLRIWRHNITPAWEQISGINNVDTNQNYVYANITEYSTIAPMVNKNPFIGDVDGNGKVETIDGVYLAKYVLNFPGYGNIYDAGDVDNNGKVETIDGVYLAKYVLNFPGYDTIYGGM